MHGNKIWVRNKEAASICHMNRKWNKRLFALRSAEYLESCVSEYYFPFRNQVGCVRRVPLPCCDNSPRYARRRPFSKTRQRLHRANAADASGAGDRAGRSSLRRSAHRLLGGSAREGTRRAKGVSGETEQLQGRDANLTRANSVDLRILKDNVDYEIFDLEELKERRMEPAGLQSEPRQQPLPFGCARFRPGRKAHSEFAQTDGRHSGRHRAGESEPAAFAQDLHRNRDRADAGRDLVCARRPRIRCLIARRN